MPRRRRFFFFRLPPPPASTLFPYTTLFRSVAHQKREGLDGIAIGVAVGKQPHFNDLIPTRNRGEDRKSTRLNSSHSQNSYAAFCLKKKTKYAYTNAVITAAFNPYFVADVPG